MSQVCPRCQGMLDPNTAGYSEHGLVCRLCHVELESQLVRQAGKMRVDSLETEIANVAGAAMGAAIGVGFRVIEGYGGERIRPSTHPEFFVYIRRGDRMVGPYHVRAIDRMWALGGLLETDEYCWPKSPDWKPLTELVPPRSWDSTRVEVRSPHAEERCERHG